MINNSTLQSRRLKAFKIASAVLFILSAFLSAATFAVRFEPTTGYIKASALSILLYIVLISPLILGIAAIFLLKKKAVVYESAGRAGTIFSSLPIAGAICFIIIRSATAAGKGSFGFYDIILLIASLFAIVYALSDIFAVNRSLTVLSGYAQILLCLLLIAEFYLDKAVEMNAPIKILIQFSLASVILSTLSDLRIILDRSLAGLFFLTKLLSSAIPIATLIGALIGISGHPEKYTPLYLAVPIFTLSYTVSALVKLTKAELKERVDEESTATEETIEEITSPDNREDDEQTHI